MEMTFPHDQTADGRPESAVRNRVDYATLLSILAMQETLSSRRGGTSYSVAPKAASDRLARRLSVFAGMQRDLPKGAFLPDVEVDEGDDMIEHGVNLAASATGKQPSIGFAQWIERVAPKSSGCSAEIAVSMKE